MNVTPFLKENLNAHKDTIYDVIKIEQQGMKAVQLVYFEDRYTIAGAADKLGYAEMTIRRWLSAFANLAGKYAGY